MLRFLWILVTRVVIILLFIALIAGSIGYGLYLILT